MSNILSRIYFFLVRPTLRARMHDNGNKVKIDMRNMTGERAKIMLYYLHHQIAKYLKVDPRHLMNTMISLDKQIIKDQKDAKFQAKYGKARK